MFVFDDCCVAVMKIFFVNPPRGGGCVFGQVCGWLGELVSGLVGPLDLLMIQVVLLK